MAGKTLPWKTRCPPLPLSSQRARRSGTVDLAATVSLDARTKGIDNENLHLREIPTIRCDLTFVEQNGKPFGDPTNILGNVPYHLMELESVPAALVDY